MGELTSFNSKIYQYSDKLTSNEEGIAHYILTHPEDVSRMRIEELENKLYVSKSSIVRFCKKLGYTGFIELKNSLKSELIESEDASINTTFQQLEYLINDYKILLNRFLKFIDENAIEMLTNEIKKSEYIYIYGFDHAFLSAQEFALRLKRLGFKAEAITQEQTLRTVIGNMESDELLILLTHECKNSDVMDIVIFTHKLNINSFLISVYSNLNVVNKVKNALILPNEIYLKSKNIISQQFVPLIMIDIVFGSLITEDKAADATFKKTFGYIEENE